MALHTAEHSPARVGFGHSPAPVADGASHIMPLPNFSPRYTAGEHAAWVNSLSDTDRTIWEVSYKLYNTLTQRGTCYHTSFFLHYYLKYHCGIEGGRVEVGFVSDGTPNSYGSHAWYVHAGRIVDLAISRPLDHINNWQGPLTILGRDIIPGWKWRYHLEGSTHGMRAVKNLFTLASDNPHDIITGAKQLHVRMSNIAQSDEAIRHYLDHVPFGFRYIDLAEKLRPIDFARAA